jgi:uncharacterized RDD family membrane protein YckC
VGSDHVNDGSFPASATVSAARDGDRTPLLADEYTSAPPASPGNRFLAWFIDVALLLSLPSMGGYVGVVLVDLGIDALAFVSPSHAIEPDPLLGFFFVAVIYVGLIALFSIAVIAYQAYLTSTTGQSLGKRWLGLKIVRSDGSRAGFVRGWLLRRFLNTAVVAVPVIGPIYWLTDALWCLGAQAMCLHDHVAGTMVIAVPPDRTILRRR